MLSPGSQLIVSCGRLLLRAKTRFAVSTPTNARTRVNRARARKHIGMAPASPAHPAGESSQPQETKMLCEHGYSMNWDCPMCLCPCGDNSAAECDPNTCRLREENAPRKRYCAADGGPTVCDFCRGNGLSEPCGIA